MRKIPLIAYACGIGAGDPGCADGPKVLQENPNFLKNAAFEAYWHSTIAPKKITSSLQSLPEITRMNTRLAKITCDFVKQRQLFVTIGGDHSSGIGTWSGVAHAMREQGDIGLIWVDAHKDSHTPLSSDTGNIHGMPVASLLGYGDAALTKILDNKPKLKPENICIVGARSFEHHEERLLQSLGVRIYYIPEIRERTSDVITQEALEICSKNTVGVGISIDLDGLDPSDAPAVGTPVEDGIFAEKIIRALRRVAAHENLLGIEIAEFNPHLDEEQKTVRVIEDCLKALIK